MKSGFDGFLLAILFIQKQRDKYIQKIKYDKRLIVFRGFRMQSICLSNWKSPLYTCYTVDAKWQATKFQTSPETPFPVVRLWDSLIMDSYNKATANAKPKFFAVTTCKLFWGKERRVFWDCVLQLCC
jgi:hypothetical protein